MNAIDLRQGRWQDALADVREVDALITDPPYGERTHSGQRHGRREGRERAEGGRWVSARGIDYDAMNAQLIEELVSHWSDRVRGWFVAFTSHDLVPAYEAALESAGRYVFAPLPAVQIGMNCRLAGDGPSNWTTWIVVARPRKRRRWGTKPGAYIGNPFDPGQNTATSTRRSSVVGSKPLWLMRALVTDYSQPGDVICDPYAGGASTLIAAASLKRTALGAEVDADTHAYAQQRCADWLSTPISTEGGQQLNWLAEVDS